MEQIKIENLTFAYPTGKGNAIEDINFSINAGEFIVLCGKSGCGKSTLLRLLKPILAPHGKTDGKIIFDSKNIDELPLKEQTEKIGFVLQSPDNQIVCDKVWHELAFGLESLSYAGDEIRSRVAEMASFFGIQNWFYKNVNELSGGQKQLLNLASVMVMQPDVLILDEPTSQLDPIAAHDFLETLSRINKELGTTIIISEHRLEEVFPLSDRIVVMEIGKIIANGTPCEIGEKLYNTENDMFLALPSPMRVYYAVPNNLDCPITVRDGRKWLLDMNIDKDITFEESTKTDKRTALELDDVYFRYEKNKPNVLKGLSFKAFENEIYAIVGGNGAGKTTALSVVSQINIPYRGKIKITENKCISALPQNPQSLFSRKTVLLDLQDVLSDIKENNEIKQQRLAEIISFCELDTLLDSHPYDLSGGEQQRAALAMVLLKNPDILLLDEPTKGLDMLFKEKLATMLKGLCNSGVTVIIVSHDIEFCAKYADRCGMFFDGHIVSEDIPRKFFSGKSFYTTAANRMARKVIPKAVLDEDIILALGGKVNPTSHQNCSSNILLIKNIPKENELSIAKKFKKKNVIFGLIFAVLFLISLYMFFHSESLLTQPISIIFLLLACKNLIPQKNFGSTDIQTPKDKRKFSKRTLIASLMILLLIPLTIFIGKYYMGDRKYYFISMLIILETLLPFTLIFEGRKPKARELIIISVLCALAVAGRTAFAMLPQFKPVVALVIISGLCFGGETGFLVGTMTGFISNFFFGQGPWTPWQMFSFGIIGFLAGILFQKGILRKTKIELCIFGFLATVIIYGGIMNSATVLMWQSKPNTEMFISAYAMGLPFDLIHAFSTVFFLWLIAEPMCEKLDRIKVKYGLVN